MSIPVYFMYLFVILGSFLGITSLDFGLKKLEGRRTEPLVLRKAIAKDIRAVVFFWWPVFTLLVVIFAGIK